MFQRKTFSATSLVLFLVLGIIFLFSINQIRESDTFWHLKTGELIWQTKSIPKTDVFSYTAYGAPWLTHEWLAEVLFYGIYKSLGLWGLIIFIAFISALAHFAMYLLARLYGAKDWVAIGLLPIFGFLTFPAWISRPQSLSALFLIWLIYFLESFRKKHNQNYLIYCVLILWFWANIHASFLLGLGILIWYVLIERKKQYLYVCFASLALVFINPHGYKIFTYGFNILSIVQKLGIQEWQSVFKFINDPIVALFTTIAIAVDGLIIWRLGAKKETRDFTITGIVVVLTILPFFAIRHFMFWPIVSYAPFVSLLSQMSEKFSFNLLNKRKIIPLTIMIFGVLISLGIFRFPAEAVNITKLPARAADFIETNNLKGPFFNLYNEGGYLLWRFSPQEKVAIDGRTDVFEGEPIKEIFTIVRAKSDFEKLINEKYKINYFILPYWPESLADSITPLVKYLVKNNWPLVYWNDDAIIFIRPTESNKTIIQKFSFQRINPFRYPKSFVGNEIESAALEIQELLRRSPDSIMAKYYAEKFLEFIPP